MKERFQRLSWPYQGRISLAYQVLNLPREQGTDMSPQAAHQLQLHSLTGCASRPPWGWKSLWPHPGAISQVTTMGWVVCHSRTLFFTFCCSTASRSCVASLSKAESWSVFSWSLEGQDVRLSLSSHLPHGQQAPEMETTALPILACSGIYTNRKED